MRKFFRSLGVLMSAQSVALHPSFPSGMRTVARRAQPQQRLVPREHPMAEAVLGISMAVLLTAGAAMTMAHDLERSFSSQVDRGPTSPSGRVGVVSVESGEFFVASALP